MHAAAALATFVSPTYEYAASSFLDDDVMFDTGDPSACRNQDDDENVVQCNSAEFIWSKMSVANSKGERRKKTEKNPTTQENKCEKEKHRRDQENKVITELADLISINCSDMNIRPDKCAILQETVNQIRQITIKQQQSQQLHQHQNIQSHQVGGGGGNNSGGGNDGCVSVNTDDVQQGEVSSSKPNILTNELVGPLVLEALGGFLFIVNSDGRLDFVTENVSEFIQYSKEELLGKSIYNIVHTDDHSIFTSYLMPTSVSWSQQGSAGGNSCGGPGGTNTANHSKSRTFNCRLLVKHPDEHDDNMDEKHCNYENMQISIALLQNKSDIFGCSVGNNEVSSEYASGASDFMCIARRISSNENHLSTPIEQFTTKLDPNGKIISIDNNGTSQPHSLYLNRDLIGKLIQELCHGPDLPKIAEHLKEVLRCGTSRSKIYKFMISPEKYIHVQTKSKLFKSNSKNENDFIMSIHSIIGDVDVYGLVQHGGNSQRNESGPRSVNNFTIISGGTNVRSNVTTPDNCNVMTTSAANNANYPSFDLDSPDVALESDSFPTSTYEPVDGRWIERPESRHSLPPRLSPTDGSDNVSQRKNSMPPPFASPPELYNDRNIAVNNVENSGNQILLTLLNKPTDVFPHMENEDTKSSALMHHAQSHQQQQQSQQQQCQHLQRQLQQTHPMSKAQTEKTILEGIGLGTSPSGNTLYVKNNKKRPSEENDESLAQRKKTMGLLDSVPPPVMSSTRNTNQSSLCEKNKMLASLLAKQPSTPSSIPHLPASIISATPQDKLPRQQITSTRINTGIGNANSFGRELISTVHSKPQMHTEASAGREKDLNMDANINNNVISWQFQTRDPDLESLLDQVIEIVPDDGITAIKVMLGEVQTQDESLSIAKTNAIDAITRSLMECEQATKCSRNQQNQQQQQQQQPSPQSQQQQQQIHQFSQIVQPISQQTTQQGQPFPPPPVYQQRSIRTLPQTVSQILSPGLPPQYNSVTIPSSNASFIVQQQVQQQTQQQQPSPQPQQQQQSQNHQFSQIAQSINQQSTQQGLSFSSPPGYQQRPTRTSLPQTVSQISTSVLPPQYNSVTVPNSNASFIVQQQLLQSKQFMQQHEQKRLLQNEQKRLLQQQQQQELLIISSNAANSQSQPPLQNIDSLLNTVAPNVSLQRSSSIPDSVISQQQQQQMQQSVNNWSQQPLQRSPNPRLTLQQQNPVLNAQLSNVPYSQVRGSYITQQQQQQAAQQKVQQSGQLQQQIRNLSSPGSRRSPFPNDMSPGTPSSYATTTSIAQPQYRLQRTNSMPNTSQVPPPGANNRSYPNMVSSVNMKSTSPQNPSAHSNATNNPLYSNMYSHIVSAEPLHAGAPYCYPDHTLPMYGPDSRSRSATHTSGNATNISNNNNAGNSTSNININNSSNNNSSSNSGMSSNNNGGTSITGGNHPSNGSNNNISNGNSNNSANSAGLVNSIVVSNSSNNGNNVLIGNNSASTSNNGNNANAMNEYVRQELKAKVGARQQTTSPRLPSMQLVPGQHVTPADLEAFGLSFEMPNSVEGDNPKWNLGPDINLSSPQSGLLIRTGLDSSNNVQNINSVGNGEKSSLLEKLLSE